MRVGLATLGVVTCFLTGAGPAEDEPQPEGRAHPMCFFPQAPPSTHGLALYACEQLYANDPPTQCCLYVSGGQCAVLCNQPTKDEPLLFKGKPVPCPGAADSPTPGTKL